MSASTSPMATVSPCRCRIFFKIPAPGEGISSVAFSLSISTSGSSTSTQSPSAFFHTPTVASRIDSPMAGTFNVSDIYPAPFPNASSINLACSSLCRFSDPAAGLADFSRVTQDHG